MAIPILTIKDFLVHGSDTRFKEGGAQILALENGQFDIAWDQDRTKLVSFDTDFNIARLNADGTKANNGALIVPKSPVDDAESQGSLASLGTLQAVAFVDRSNPYANGVIRLNFYNNGAFKADSGFRGDSIVVDASAGPKHAPEVVALNEGRLAVAYVDGASSSVKLRIYDAAHAGFIAPSVTVSTTKLGAAAAAPNFALGLSALSDGNVAVSWRDGTDTTYLSVLDEDGRALSGALRIGTALDKVSLAESDDGRLAVVATGRNGVELTSFDTGDFTSSGPVRLEAGGTDPAVAALDDGRLFVVWARNGDIQGGLFFSDGQPDGGRFTVAANDDLLARPTIATLADGRVAVSYENATKGGIYASVYDPREEGVTLTGTKGADQLVGTRFNDVFRTGSGNDTITGGGGNDFFDGGKGADRMIGGAGNDTYVVDNRHDVVVEAANGGIDTVRSKIALQLGAHIENGTLTGGANVRIIGNEGANVLTGNRGNNTLFGQGGADTLAGGAGNDTYFLASQEDRIVEAKGGGFDKLVLAGSSYKLAAGVELEAIAVYNTKLGATLTGNEFGQTLSGGQLGSNFLDGKGGADTLIGGGRGDAFYFTTALGAGNVDRIASFGTATDLPYKADNDMIGLSAAVFKGLAKGTLSAAAFTANVDGVAKDALDRIIYETDTGSLYFDGNGSAAGGRVQFATIGSLSGGGALTAGDFLVV